MGKDYYKILGVEKNATAEEIKKAFRKLAHQHHPDKQTGDEQKFKEINEAYQVLGKEEKRKQYDQFGSTFDQQGGFGGGVNWDDFMKQAKQGGGFGGMNFDFGGFDLGDMVGDIFGFGGSRKKTKKQYGEDIQVNLKIDFKESIFGTKKQIELYKNVKCEHCHGNLAEPGTKINTCKTCNGQGKITRVQQTMLGAFQTSSVCQDCGGEGKKPEVLCSKCSGHGIVKKQETVDLNIPAGIENGSVIRYSGQGEAGAFGGPAGDLHVIVDVEQDENFTRKGNDIYTNKKISFLTAVLGGKVDVETLDGNITLKIPPSTQPNAKFRIKGKGASNVHSNNQGDLYIIVNIEVPKKISRKQRKLLEEFENLED